LFSEGKRKRIYFPPGLVFAPDRTQPTLFRFSAVPRMISRCLFESFDPRQGWRAFSFEDACDELVARAAGDVLPVLAQAQQAVDQGLHVAGYLAYEAAAGLDSHLAVRPAPSALPLACFGVFRTRRPCVPSESDASAAFSVGKWTDSVDFTTWCACVERIRAYIAAGDTYQANYTFRRHAEFQGDPFAFYRALCRTQRAGYCAYLDLGRFVVLSISPELFFGIKNGLITVRPMKGTFPRGCTFEEDERLAGQLAACVKNRAENIMIVDLLRNDLGRIARTGTVRTKQLFHVERYETVLQMTSTVEARLREGIKIPELFSALFPSGSVTGAPKIRTMQILRELETTPRGVYTGCIGYFSPAGVYAAAPGDGDGESASPFAGPGIEAEFNVAIRTLRLDTQEHRLEMGVGGGITYDSHPAEEYEECRIKSAFLLADRPEFQLLESFLWEPDSGYYLLDRHLHRLEQSARYFDFPFVCEELLEALRAAAAAFPPQSAKVRLLLARDGKIAVERLPLTASPAPGALLRVGIAREPVSETDPFLYHKTTHRAVYESRLRAHPDREDVLLVNSRGELTESTRANLVVRRGDALLTPPVSSGLLAGTFRQELLDAGCIREQVLYPADLESARELFLINSVRRWIPLRLISTGGPCP
jgi:para-aminobenzoate synthetase/4-amino-4-deoxychorismate lyase